MSSTSHRTRPPKVRSPLLRRNSVAVLMAAVIGRGVGAYGSHGTYWYAGPAADSVGYYAYVFADNNHDQSYARIVDFIGQPSNGGTSTSNWASRNCGPSSAACTNSASRTPPITVAIGHWYRSITCAKAGSHFMTGAQVQVGECLDYEYNGDLGEGEVK
jgi:hypothetical protein